LRIHPQFLGIPREYIPLVAGGCKASEKGRQRTFEVSVGRGKAELFPLQGLAWGKSTG